MTDRAVLLIRRRRPIGEPPDLQPGSVPSASILRGSAGAGRILHSMSELGFRVPDIVQSLHGAETTADELLQLDVGREFAMAILGSHLINTTDEALRRAYLRAAIRHVVRAGDVLVEHHPVDWAETAAPTPATPGAEVGMRNVRRDPPFVSAVSVYDIGGRIVRQPFTARVLSEEELAGELGAAGLVVRRRLSPTWLLAGPAPPAGAPARRV
jgi:hypothetical protein